MKPKPSFLRAFALISPWLGLADVAYSQTIYDWKDTAPDANWTQGAAGARWWDNTNSNDLWDIPPGGGVLRFNNNAQLSMNNNAAGTYNASGFIFGAAGTSARTLAGNAVRFYDFGGNDPYIQNDSSATHIINLNIEGDGDSADPLNINLNSTGGLTFGGTINNQGSGINVGGTTTSAATVTANGVISGSGGLTKSNANTILALNATNTYTGGTTINAGVVNLTGGGGGSGTIRGTATVNTGGTLRLSTGDATGYNTGAASLTTINLTGGTLNVNTTANQTLGGATINMTGGAITGIANSNLDFFQGTSTLNSLASATTSTISGTKIQIRQTGGLTFTTASGTTSSGIDLDVSSIISSHGSFTAQPFIKAGAGTMRLSSASTFSGPTNVNNGKLIVTGSLRNTSALTVASTGTLELGATNVFTSGHGAAMGNTRTITVNGGTLLMNTNFEARFGNVTLNNGGTWTSNRALTSYDALLANTDTGAATVSVTGTGLATMNGSGGIHLQGVQNFNVADTVAGSGTDLSVGMILAAQGTTGGAAGGINKTGAGTMLLNNVNNSFSGDITVGAGTIVTGTTQGGGTNGYLGAVSGSRTITISTGAVLDFRANNEFGGSGKTAATIPSTVVDGGTLTSTRFNIIGNLTLNGGTLTQSSTDSGAYEGYQFLGNVTVGGTSPSTISSSSGKANHLLGGSSITFNVADATSSTAADLIVSNILRDGSGDYTGVGGLIKSGVGTMQLNATNTYSGATSVSAGTLVLAAGGAAGSIGNSAITVEAGAKLALATGDATGYSSSAALTIRGEMVKSTGNFHDTLNRDVTLDGGTITATDGNTTSGGAINLLGNTITTTTGTTSNINITGSTLQLRTDGAATPNFNVVTGSTLNLNTVVDGYLGTDTAPLTKSGGGTMVLLQNNVYDGTTLINAGTVQVGNGGTTGSVGLGNVTDNGTLDINRSNSYALGNNISGSGTLTHSGSGTTTLSGTNTYTGVTTVSAGTLLVNGSLGDTAVTVASGAILGGSGSIGTNTVLNTVTVNGTLAPGESSSGLLTISDDLGLNGALNMDIQGLSAGSSYDQIALNGSSSLGGTLNLLWSLGAPASINTELFLIANDGSDAFTGAFSNIADLAQVQDNLGNTWEVHYAGGDGNDLTLVAIPEPQPVLLGLMGSLALLRRRRTKASE